MAFPPYLDLPLRYISFLIASCPRHLRRGHLPCPQCGHLVQGQGPCSHLFSARHDPPLATHGLLAHTPSTRHHAPQRELHCLPSTFARLYPSLLIDSFILSLAISLLLDITRRNIMLCKSDRFTSGLSTDNHTCLLYTSPSPRDRG